MENSEKKFVKEICKCSLKLPIHYKCLIDWFKKKCKFEKEKKIFNFDFSKLYCDICKEKIEIKNSEKQKYFNFKNKIGNFENSVILEIFNSKGILESIYYIPFEFNNEKFFLGGYKNKLITFTNDISKSFAQIEFYENKFYFNFLINNSKFQILKRCDEILKIENFEGKAFFFGKFYLKICKIRNMKKCKCGFKTKKMKFMVPEIKRKNSGEENFDKNVNLKKNINLLRKKSISNSDKKIIFMKAKKLSEKIFEKKKNIDFKEFFSNKNKNIKKKCFFKYNNDLSKKKNDNFFGGDESVFFQENTNQSQFFNFED